MNNSKLKKDLCLFSLQTLQLLSITVVVFTNNSKEYRSPVKGLYSYSFFAWIV